MAFEYRAADEGWPTVEAHAGAMLRAGEIADTRLIADFCAKLAEALR